MSDLVDLAPPAVARWVLDKVARGLRGVTAANGGRPAMPPGTARFIEALQAVADGAPVCSDIGTEPRTVGLDPGWVSTATAARIAGCSERYVRKLAAAGVIRGRREGPRFWLVDLDGLQRQRLKGTPR